MNMKMPYSALLVLFLSLTFFTPSTLAGLRISLKAPMVPPPSFHHPYKPPDISSPPIPREPAPYKPPPLYRSTSQKP
ncbi:hypothetical protein D0Y65_026915 [Glycine soja]|uniref:Transmembrane protein n=1 Tax=Glycine soja TaxID=3848 RepID=A0A0B2RSE2_GLYSO|nr:hypothetical protein JHK87_027899 [Glycine soja]KHN35268.1 hypothetical protein glysoja_048792 [Glycine soja]RZB86996.1 hypothetical protein D0Y65_026915 [Glycine soja]